MKVHLYAACWNEIDMLDFFFRHYDPWVDRYFIFDDGSDDGSVERLARNPKVTLRRLQRTQPTSLILSLLDLYNHGWKSSRGEADWVVVVNIDEHLQHDDMPGYLRHCRERGVTAIPALGYQMIAPRLPAEGSLAEGCTRGMPWPNMSKLALFAPAAVDEIAYRPGRHSASPTGDVRYPECDEVLNLHFKCLDAARVLERHRRQQPRLQPTDIAHGWGHRYGLDDDTTRAWLAQIERDAIRLDDDGHQPHRDHPGARWWRDAGG
jgi:hypothetical protein